MPTKHKIKYKVNKVNLSDTEINQHKDFRKLMTNYQKATTPLAKTPLYKYKNKNIFLVILIILLLLWLLFSEAINEDIHMDNIDKSEQSDN